MATVSASIRAAIECAMVDAVDGNRRFDVPPIEAIRLAAGSGEYQINQVFCDFGRSLGDSATHNIDLIGATLTDPFGVALAMAKVRFMWFRAPVANPNNVVLFGTGGTFNGPLTGTNATLVVAPGDEHWLCGRKVGWAAAAGTTDLLKVTNPAAGTVTYDCIILGST